MGQVFHVATIVHMDMRLPMGKMYREEFCIATASGRQYKFDTSENWMEKKGKAIIYLYVLFPLDQ